MKIIGTVTATLAGRDVERAIPPLEVANDTHVFAIEDRAVEETFPEDRFDHGWTFTTWLIIEEPRPGTV